MINTPLNIVNNIKVGYNISAGGGCFELIAGYDFRRISEKPINAAGI